METLKWGAGFLSNLRTSCQEWLSLLEGLIGTKEKFSCFLHEKWRVKNAVQHLCVVCSIWRGTIFKQQLPCHLCFFRFSFSFQYISGSCVTLGADKAKWISGWMKQKRKESGWGCKILTNIRSFWISSLQNVSMLRYEGIFQYTIKIN